MTIALPIYSTGTVSVSNLGTVVTGVGCMWSGINAKQGDYFTRADGTAVITEVTDATHLKITPWPGATISGGPYAIQQNYVGRVVGVAAAEDVGVMLEKLHVDGLPFIVGPDETAPDPSYGDDGQLAFQPTTGTWWTKTGGAWVISYGMGSFPDAPSDSILYGRKNAGWVAVPAGLDCVTPEMFGGIGDGSATHITVNNTALQAAMADPRPLYIPSGKNYLFSQAATFSLASSTKLVFGSGLSSALTMTHPTQHGLVKNSTGGSNLIVRDLQITTNVAKTAGAAIRCTGSSAIGGQDVVENCRLWAPQATPLWQGIAIETDVIPFIRGNYILTCAESGIVLNNVVSGGGGEAIITGNTFNTTLAAGNNAAAIRYQTGLGSLRISDNIIQSYDTGVNIQAQASASVTALIISGNSFEQNQQASISLNPVSGANMVGVSITGNSFLNMVGQCLAVYGASTWINSIAITGNVVLFGVDYAFNIQAAVCVVMANNVLQQYASAVTGVLLGASYPVSALIEGNTFYPGNVNAIMASSNPGARAVGNIGYNPVGSFAPTAGASPWTYTAGATPETLCLTASGGITTANMGGLDLVFGVGASIPVTLPMNPREAVIITYTGTLYPRVFRH